MNFSIYTALLILLVLQFVTCLALVANSIRLSKLKRTVSLFHARTEEGLARIWTVASRPTKRKKAAKKTPDGRISNDTC